MEATLPAVLADYMLGIEGSVLVAWNMKAHDRHVLKRAVGETVLEGIHLWDALPWFRKLWGLPKNSLSNCKPGTPRSLFGVVSQGPAHSSLVDASHMRDVVLRASYCVGHETDYWRNATRLEMLSELHSHLDGI
jgi:hypothetical protein